MTPGASAPLGTSVWSGGTLGAVTRHKGALLALVTAVALAISVTVVEAFPNSVPRPLGYAPSPIPPSSPPSARDAALDRATLLPDSSWLRGGLDGMSFNASDCSSLTDCLFGGSLLTGSGDTEAVALGLRRGSWGHVTVIPGTQNSWGQGQVSAVACLSWRYCIVGGQVTNQNASAPFLATEVNGKWGTAFFPWRAAPRTPVFQGAPVSGIACQEAGECTAVVDVDSSPVLRYDTLTERSFVSILRNGHWSEPLWLPGLFHANKLVCSTFSHCVVAGVEEIPGVAVYAKVISLTNGRATRQAVLKPAEGRWDPYEVDALTCRDSTCAAAVCANNMNYGEFEFVALGTAGRWRGATTEEDQCGEELGQLDYVGLFCGERSCLEQSQFGALSKRQGAAYVNEASVARVSRSGWRRVSTEAAPPVNPVIADEPASYDITCTSPGNCIGAVGLAPHSGNPYFVGVAVEQSGQWGPEVPISGLAAGPGSTDSQVTTVSCASVIVCAAGGTYIDAAGALEAFVADRTSSGWSAPVALPKVVRWNAGRNAAITSVACSHPDWCEGVGTYTDATGTTQSFSVAYDGRGWSPPTRLPTQFAGPGAFTGLGSTLQVQSLSCWRPGACVATGQANAAGGSVAFEVALSSGRWSHPWELDSTVSTYGTSAIDVACNDRGSCAQVATEPQWGSQAMTDPAGVGSARSWTSVGLRGEGDLSGIELDFQAISCAPIGQFCEAVGVAEIRGNETVIAAGEVRGHWDRAVSIPGIVPQDVGEPNTGWQPTVTSVACPALGDCILVGALGVGLGDFIAQMTSGRWQPAVLVRGSAAPPNLEEAPSVACVKVGLCALATLVARGSFAVPAVVWIIQDVIGSVYEFPGEARQGTSAIDALACARDGWCVAGGSLVGTDDSTDAAVVTFDSATAR